MSGLNLPASKSSHSLASPLFEPDRFIEHGTRETCLTRAGLDLAGLSAQVETWWALQSQARIRSVSSA
jgi:deoxyxylulose-5-phosphate synthase